MLLNGTRDAWTSFIRARCEGLLGVSKTHKVGPGSRERTVRLDDADLELEVYKEFGAILRQTRNKLSPVGALPAEVLALIFAFAQDKWEPKRITVKPSSNGFKPEGKLHCFYLGWMLVTHVSHTWRQVGLETAPLWQRLPCLDVPPLFASEIICRSRRLPLELLIDDWVVGGRASRSSLSGWLCLSVLRRTSEFCVQGISSDDIRTWHTLLVHPMPTLRKLVLQLYEDEDVVRLLPGAFPGGCPVLTDVFLSDCFPQWNSHLFLSPLTRLALATTWIDGDEAFLPDTTEFRAILAALPTLEELELTKFYPRAPIDGVRPVAFTLPTCFRRLTVNISCGNAYESANANFWATFVFPSTTAICFDVGLDELDVWDADVWHFLDPFIQLHDSGSDPQELFLDLYHITMSYTEDPSSSTRLYYSSAMYLPSRRRVWATAEVPLYLNHLQLARLSSVRFTSAVQGHYAAPDAWISAFSVATSVQRVTITLQDVIPLLGALSATRPDGGMSLFPQMRTLIVNRDTDADEGKNGLELDMSLMDLVNIREGASAPIQEILVPEAISSWLIWTHIGEKATVTFYKYT